MPAVDGTGSPPAADVGALFRRHHADLVRLAALLTGDRGRAEEVVQDAWLGLHRKRGRLAEPDRAVGYLRRSVVNGCRSDHRRRLVAARAPEAPERSAAPAEDGAVSALRAAEVVAAVRALPDRQRACTVLRFYAGLTDAEIAEAVGVSVGSVKTHLHRARAALAAVLGEES